MENIKKNKIIYIFICIIIVILCVIILFLDKKMHHQKAIII